MKNYRTIYGSEMAKCSWCKRTLNPHPEYSEPIPVKFIEISRNITLTLCLWCFEQEVKESNECEEGFEETLREKYDAMKLIGLE